RKMYRPRLANGQVVSLGWPMVIYRLFNIVSWPVEEHANKVFRIFVWFCYVLAFLVFIEHNDAELRYIRHEFQNMDQMLTCVPTYLILIETHIRGFYVGFLKAQFRKFLQNFYANIYVDKYSFPVQYKRIRYIMLPTLIYSSFYFLAVLSFLIVPILNLIYRRKDLVYKMIFPFDYTPLYIFLPVMFTNVWAGILVVTMEFGEANVFSEVIVNLTARYDILRERFANRVGALLQRKRCTDISAEFEAELIETIKQNVELNRFALRFQEEFSFRIFVQFAFSAAILCALGFKVYTNPVSSYGYIFWILAKILEMLALGSLGSNLITMTDEISSMYYNCNWELVVERVSDAKKNVHLMKLIMLAIATNQQPISITGLNFFSVSQLVVLKILQGAGSYFTCLISLR
ncbi:odorant receptor 74a, partial [Teleopsis dalmanni]|uniref:odorant receptor 74a n=1 Tax=Teleopsis dalmanni TaxID=139649 RepID=UPI0018CE390D